MLPVYAGISLVALAASAGAARALETDKKLYGAQRGAVALMAQLWEAALAPAQQALGTFNKGGKFGATNIFTGTVPGFLTSGLRTANTILMPHHVAGVNGVGIDPSSPFTLGDYSGQASKRASEHTVSALLLFGDGVVNATSAILTQQLKERKEAVNTIRRFQRRTVGVLDFVRWNADTVFLGVALGSAGNSHS